MIIRYSCLNNKIFCSLIIYYIVYVYELLLSIASIVDNCVSGLEKNSTYVVGTFDEEFVCSIIESPVLNVDTMVNILVQDMSECTTGIISDSNVVTRPAESDYNVQLWVN